MIQISIKKQEQITNQASFPTLEEAQAWLTLHESMKSFGQPKQIIHQQVELEPAVIEKQLVLIKEAQLDEQGVEISPAEFEEQDVVVKEALIELQELELIGDYEVVIENISAKLDQEKLNDEAQKFLDSTDFKVLRHIRQKALGQELSLSEEEYLVLELERSDAAARIVR